MIERHRKSSHPRSKVGTHFNSTNESNHLPSRVTSPIVHPTCQVRRLPVLVVRAPRSSTSNQTPSSPTRSSNLQLLPRKTLNTFILRNILALWTGRCPRRIAPTPYLTAHRAGALVSVSQLRSVELLLQDPAKPRRASQTLHPVVVVSLTASSVKCPEELCPLSITHQTTQTPTHQMSAPIQLESLGNRWVSKV